MTIYSSALSFPIFNQYQSDTQLSESAPVPRWRLLKTSERHTRWSVLLPRWTPTSCYKYSTLHLDQAPGHHGGPSTLEFGARSFAVQSCRSSSLREPISQDHMQRSSAAPPAGFWKNKSSPGFPYSRFTLAAWTPYSKERLQKHVLRYIHTRKVTSDRSVGTSA